MDDKGGRDELVAKRLRQSELGWFEACRIAGRETGRQRALNLDAGIVEALFSPGDAVDCIEVDERWWDGHRVVEGVRPIRLQHKNWRLAGTVVKSERFVDAQPDDIVFLHFEQDGETDAWSLTWDLVSQSDSNTASIFEMVRECLGAQSAVLVPEGERRKLLSAARRRLRSFRGDPFADTADLTDEEWEQVTAWLREHLTIQKMRAMLRSNISDETRAILRALGTRERERAVDIADEVLRRFGTELLTDAARRAMMAKARFPERGARPAEVTKWRRGGPASVGFTKALGLPACMAGSPVTRPEDFEDVDAFRPLGPLHAYQETIAKGIRGVLHAKEWEKRRAIAWMPTGTGKTRVTVETVLLECALEAPRNCILWVADREELCEQAVETFRHVWMVRGREARCTRAGIIPTMRIIRLWGGREWQEPPTHPTVIVASIQTLASRLSGAESEPFHEELAILGERAAAVIFDEAHHVVAPSYLKVIRALGLDRQKNYLGRDQKTAPPLLGLTATPARRHDDETEILSRRFGGVLIEPDGAFRSLKGFEEDGYLSRTEQVTVDTKFTIPLTDNERAQFAQFNVLPTSALKKIGGLAERTEFILRDLEQRLQHLQSVLVFACSVDHAHMMAEVLARRGHRAAALDGSTPRAVRWRTIQRFRDGGLRVLVNCDLLATGFDAPNVDAVVLARPVESQILYAQMVGRGLRGRKNGGTDVCHVIDYQDRFEALPDLDKLRESFRSMFLKPSTSEVPPAEVRQKTAPPRKELAPRVRVSSAPVATAPALVAPGSDGLRTVAGRLGSSMIREMGLGKRKFTAAE